jgi:hypothetical protein
MPPNGTNVQVNQTIPGLNNGLRLNLIINVVEKTAAIIDVVTSFKNRYAAFKAVRNEVWPYC